MAKLVLIFILLLSGSSLVVAGDSLDPVAIEKAVRMKGKFHPAQQVYRLAWDRPNLANLEAWKVPLVVGTASTASFAATGSKQAVLVSETVLYEDEVGPAMRAALDGGLEVQALHRHIYVDQPNVFVMHLAGRGDAVKLAAALRQSWDAARQVRTRALPFERRRFEATVPTENHLSPTIVEACLPGRSETGNGLVRVSYSQALQVHGASIAGTPELNSWANFAGTEEAAVVVARMAVPAPQLQTVLKTLVKSRMTVLAIEQQQTTEQPRQVFVHYWGEGSLKNLAQVVRSALPAGASDDIRSPH